VAAARARRRTDGRGDARGVWGRRVALHPLPRQRDGTACVRASGVPPRRDDAALERSELAEVGRRSVPTPSVLDLHYVVRRRRRRGSESSRPPVTPDGRRISTSAMNAPSTTRRDPSGRSSRKPTCTPDSACDRKESSPLTSRAPTTAPNRLDAPPIT